MAPRSSTPASTNRIVWDASEVEHRLAALPARLALGVKGVLSYQAPQVESMAKANAPWTDRTGNARQGIAAQTYERDSAQGIVLYGQVPYQIWLEVRFSGRYSTILPTIEAKGPDVMRMINKLLGRI